MPRYGRIENDVVREIVVADELPPMHWQIKEMFMLVPDGVEVGWIKAQGGFIPPPPASSPEPPTLDQQMDAILDTLPMEVQIQFANALTAGKLFIDTNRLDRLAALITTTPVPPELEEVKAQLLALIPEQTDE